VPQLRARFKSPLTKIDPAMMPGVTVARALGSGGGAGRSQVVGEREATGELGYLALNLTVFIKI
jgi:hypothetical protein